MDDRERAEIKKFTRVLRKAFGNDVLDRLHKSSDILYTVVIPLTFFQTIHAYFGQISSLTLQSGSSRRSSLDFDQETLLNLEYLKLVLRKCQSIRLLGPSDASRTVSNLSELNGIRSLVMRKVPASFVHGLSQYSQQIECLEIDSCGLPRLEYLLRYCLGDQVGNPNQVDWSSLNRLIISGENLDHQKLDCLKLAPNLHVLELKGCQIDDFIDLSELSRLRFLSLACNHLNVVPRVLPDSKIVTLLLQNNHLESLTGLEAFQELKYLDIGWNMLIHHDALAPVSVLEKLETLNTIGNPLTVENDHRVKSIQWVSARVDADKFVFDEVKITTPERYVLGLSKIVPIDPLTPIQNQIFPAMRSHHASEGPSSVGPDPLPDSVEVESSLVSTNVSGSERRKKGRFRTRTVEIEEPQSVRIEKEEAEKQTRSAWDNAGGDKDHLDMKKKVEELRKTFGERNWLQGEAGDQLRNVLGLDKSDTRSTLEALSERISDIEQKEQAIQRYLEQAAMAPKATLESLDTSESEDTNSIEKLNEIEENENLKPEEESGDEMTSSFYSLYKSKENENHSEQNVLSVDVRAKVSDNEEYQPRKLLFGPEFVQEASESGLILEQWFVHSIEACEVLKRQPAPKVHFMFSSSSKGTRKERIYQLSDESVLETILEIVRPVLEAQERHAMRLSAMQCVKCHTEFAFDKAKIGSKSYVRDDEKPTCPNCLSNMVIELESELAETHQTSRVDAEDEKDIQLLSSSQGSLNEDNFRQNMSDTSTPRKPERSRSSSAKKPNNSTHCKRLFLTDNKTDLPQKENKASTLVQRSESSSDISVLSNPSQSSIEVLHQKSSRVSPNTEIQPEEQDRTITAEEGRKYQEEPIFKTSALTPILRTSSSANAMLESSSSGSMAESIIANYGESGRNEGNNANPNNVKEEELEVAEEAEDAMAQLSEKSDESGLFLNRKGTARLQQEENSDSTQDDSDSYKTCNSDFSLGMVTANSTLTSSMMTANSTLASSTIDEESTLDQSSSRLASSTTGAFARDSFLKKPRDIFAAIKTSLSESTLPVTSEGIMIPDEDVYDMGEFFSLWKSNLEWNYDDFEQVDHRLMLFCELNLCQESEERVLMIGKSLFKLHTHPKMFVGVICITNKNAHVLKMKRPECEEPETFLELVRTVGLNSLGSISRLVGSQGVRMDFDAITIHVVFRDCDRVNNFISQLSQKFLENVRQTPLPIGDDSQDVTNEVSNLLERHLDSESDLNISLFLSGHIKTQKQKKELVSIVVIPNFVMLLADIFLKRFTRSGSKLVLRKAIELKDLNFIELYDSKPRKIGLGLDTLSSKEKLVLTLETERNVHSLLLNLKDQLKRCHDKEIEDMLIFSFLKDHESARFHKVQLQDSLESTGIEISEWIEVIKKKLSTK